MSFSTDVSMKIASLLSGPKVPKPIAPPAPTDPVEAIMKGLAYADMQRKLAESKGRRGAILSGNVGTPTAAVTPQRMLGA